MTYSEAVCDGGRELSLLSGLFPFAGWSITTRLTDEASMLILILVIQGYFDVDQQMGIQMDEAKPQSSYEVKSTLVVYLQLISARVN